MIATALSSAGADSVTIITENRVTESAASEMVDARDTNADGAADSLTASLPGGDRMAFALPPAAGATEIAVTSNASGDLVVRDESGVDLAAIAVKPGLTSAALSRTLVQGESIELWQVGAGVASDTVTVQAAGVTRVSRLKLPSGGFPDGGIVEVEGDNLTGNEVLELICDKPGETTWQAATLTSSAVDHLEFELPDLSLTSATRVVVRIYNNGTERKKIYSTFATIVPD
jgi:hypothetical protein